MWRIPGCLLYFWTTDSHLLVSTVALYRRNWWNIKGESGHQRIGFFVKSEAVKSFFFFVFFCFRHGSSDQIGNNGAQLLISYTESHDVLGYLEEFHLIRQYVNAQVHWKGWHIKLCCTDFSNMETHSVYRLCFIPSCLLLADNKTLPAALVPVFFCDVVLCSRACWTAVHGGCDEELKTGDPGCHISSFGVSSEWLRVQKKKRNHELSFWKTTAAFL